MIKETIKKSIKFLLAEQERNGSFPSYTSLHENNFNNAYKCESVFSTTLILSALCKLAETPEIKIIKRKAAYFLLNQKTNHWTFNYWDRRSKDYLKMPYPDDLDDTSCALSALYEYNNKLIDGDVMAKFVTLLTHLEIKEGGPYKSWITNPEADKVWHDTDLAVNSNIAYFLSLHEVNLEGLNNFIDKAITRESYTSPYYTSPFPIIYFISRSYNGINKKNIADFLNNAKNKNNNWNNPLFTALSLTTLNNIHHHNNQEESIDYIIKNCKNGAWPAQSFYLGINPKGDNNKYHAGSKALTTAFCLEALSKHKNNKQKRNINNSENKNFIKHEVIKNTKTVFKKLDQSSQKEINQILEKNLKTDKEQPIILLAYFFTQMLNNANKQININHNICLGEINLQGWIAYTIYDNIIDYEGDEKLLPIANILSRKVYKNILYISQNNPDFKNFFEDILSKIDSANSWEINNCRIAIKKNTIDTKNYIFPDFKDLSILAQKSMGHAIGPIAILMLLGYSTDSKEVKHLLLFFKHYIIARQLNDDAHDWEKDLKNGQITYVVIKILKKYKKNKINLEKDLHNLQKIFWYDCIEEICKKTISHTEKAKTYIQKIKIINDYTLFNNFLFKTQNASQLALDERKKTIEFLKTYKKMEK